MKVYLPKIIYNSPTKLPKLEKKFFYYIVHKMFNSNSKNNENLNLEINIDEFIKIVDNSTLQLLDLKSQTINAINNLNKINISLVDNGFHIKLSPFESVYLSHSIIYITINPIIIEYLDQISTGNYIVFDLITDCIVNSYNNFI
ncbi:RepB family plasmid replication initiator protein [Romboutsia lituseburensis]|uniref:RepB family plasmid replication initiator protein n=1 Tax=Romboutsia lituseburensis TaxID=1537 RepID=UPI0022EA32E0|nr:RepB family plasmid replication initiator protein [Romboutsia lituseburensis]